MKDEELTDGSGQIEGDVFFHQRARLDDAAEFAPQPIEQCLDLSLIHI